MQRNLRNATLACVAILGLLMLVYPFLSSMAQKGQNQKNQKTQEQENALKVVRQNVVANIFYDALQTQEDSWALTKADFISGGTITNDGGAALGQTPESVHLVVRKDKSEAEVTIYEYASEESAKFPLKIHVSQGVIENCKGDECGDEGQKIYEGFNDKRVNVGFVSLRFRKDRFFVSIRCSSEEVAKRFANYAINAIASK